MSTRMFATTVFGAILIGVGVGVVALRDRGSSAQPMTVSGLVETLRSGNLERRRDAAAMLGLVRGPRADLAARALVESLRDRDAAIRGQAARSIGRLLALNPSLTDVVGPLTALLRDDEPCVRTSAAIGLRSAGLDPPGAFETVVEGLRSVDPTRRAEAGALLAAWPIGDGNRLRRLLTLTDDPVEAGPSGRA